MKREKLIKAKLNEKQVVDFDELKLDDARSLDSMLRNADDELYDVQKKIKAYASNHTLTLGEDFISLKAKERDINDRIKLIKDVQAEYLPEND